MSTPLNQELREYRVRIEQYRKVLKIDEDIKNGGENRDNRPLLSEKDILDINNKINLLTDKLNGLLSVDDDS